ncbi:MAG: NAD(P)/FAD-dependent oxidoreductase [Rhodobacteraceae bacterium]|nr:NAD(P)/FAD-dependent oxidoreductase [Paracoccaceae bacterium]
MTANSWLRRFSETIVNGDRPQIARLFIKDAFWRDYLAFGWTLRTVEGSGAIADLGVEFGPRSGFRNAVFEGNPSDHEGFFSFETSDGKGRGYVRVSGDNCETLFTQLDDLTIPAGVAGAAAEPFVLVVGGGQGGLALGAQLSDLGVPYLIVDKHPRVGDQWRFRYDSLILHDPVWYNHMPFKPFPENWPVFTPKDRMGDWLENYAEELDLEIWTETALKQAAFDKDSRVWTAQLKHGGEPKTIRPTHIVIALGLSGFPKVPVFEGQNIFAGPQLHSSEYRHGLCFAGKDVVVVGANNSAHDIAADLVAAGARPTLLQRSSSLVVLQGDYCDRILGPLYSVEAVEKGVSTERADILQASVPLRVLERKHRAIWDQIRKDRHSHYQRLADTGFTLDFAEDGTGLGTKYRRTASGYYIDVGASEMVMDGRIGVKSGCRISHLSERAVHLKNGDALGADAVIYATGYGNMIDWVTKFMGPETASHVGPCWGYGSNTKGDPGPWIGELRNMWVETAQPGLWFTGGNLSQARYFSRLLALQLARHFRMATAVTGPRHFG